MYKFCDYQVNKRIKPLSKNLDSINPYLKYGLGNNQFGIISLGAMLNSFIMPMGISSINLLSNISCFRENITSNWFDQIDYSELNIITPNKISKSLRLISIIEGFSQIGIGLYSIITEKYPSPINYFLINSGLSTLNVGIGTYIFQSKK